jgi:hypothetical protein
MPAARIYQRAKNAMQSGRARAAEWVLEYEPAERKLPDPLTGWAGSGDTREQVKIAFPSLDAARAYAEAQGLSAHVVPAAQKQIRIRTYAENFK